MTITRLKQRGEYLLATALAAMPGLAAAEYGLNLPRPVTPIAHDILELHNMILIICVTILVIVFSFMFYAIIVHRKSRGHKAATFEENAKLEVVWTVIPFLILLGMAIPSTATLLRMDDTRNAEMTIKITGYQWRWHYDYMGEDVRYFSALTTPGDQVKGKVAKGENYLLEVDNPMVVPVGKKIRLLLTANDVIHAWWVPQLGVKKDAIPGYINEMWTRVDEPGTYRGQCAELCGKDHAFMPIVVKAVEVEEYSAWLTEQKKLMAKAEAAATKDWTKQALMERGEVVYKQVCVACHLPNGAGVPGVFPAIAGSKIATGPIDAHLDIVMNGKPGTAMQAFKVQLNDADLAAIVTFERNAFGNEAGDAVQPSQIKALRQ